jgi:hypothetical protein
LQYLTPAPSPARNIIYERDALLAGEGEYKREGALPPLNALSPFQTSRYSYIKRVLFERGTKGESISFKQSRILPMGVHI